jgi:hypothetical protein
LQSLLFCPPSVASHRSGKAFYIRFEVRNTDNFPKGEDIVSPGHLRVHKVEDFQFKQGIPKSKETGNKGADDGDGNHSIRSTRSPLSRKLNSIFACFVRLSRASNSHSFRQSITSCAKSGWPLTIVADVTGPSGESAATASCGCLRASRYGSCRKPLTECECRMIHLADLGGRSHLGSPS